MTRQATTWPEFVSDLRLLTAMQLSRACGWAVYRLIGTRHFTEGEQLTRMREALSTITTLVDARHPACAVAIEALQPTEQSRP